MIQYYAQQQNISQVKASISYVNMHVSRFLACCFFDKNLATTDLYKKMNKYVINNIKTVYIRYKNDETLINILQQIFKEINVVKNIVDKIIPYTFKSKQQIQKSQNHQNNNNLYVNKYNPQINHQYDSQTNKENLQIHKQNKLLTYLLKENQQIRKQISLNLVEQKAKQGFISRNLGKLKRKFSLSKQKIITTTIQSKINNSKDQNQLIKQILKEYSFYLNKLMAVNLFSPGYMTYHDINYCEQIKENPQKFKIVAWKFFNLIKKSPFFFANIQKIANYYPKLNKYTFSMINFIAIDSQILYNLIVDYRQFNIQKLQWQYQINVQSYKNVRKVQLQRKKCQFTKTDIFIETQAVMTQIQLVNQIILRVVYSSVHRRYLVNLKVFYKFKPSSVQCFDRTYQILNSCSQKQKQHKQTKKINDQFINVSKQSRLMKAAQYKSSKLQQLRQSTTSSITESTLLI